VPQTVAEVALVLFVGMGPIKVVVFYLDAIRDAEPGLARRVAVRAVATATIATLGLLLAGSVLMRLLHFSTIALLLAGGIVLLAYAIQTVLDTSPGSHTAAPPSEAALLRMAVYPMGVPLILNPAGIAAATIFSAEAASFGEVGILVAVVLLVAALDVAVLFAVRPIGPRLPPEAIIVLEQLLGVVLAAVAIELLILGLRQLGVLA
jgi:multiple antibiotic resistance protein